MGKRRAVRFTLTGLDGAGKGRGGDKWKLVTGEFSVSLRAEHLELGAATPPEPSSALAKRTNQAPRQIGSVIMHKPVCPAD